MNLQEALLSHQKFINDEEGGIQFSIKKLDNPNELIEADLSGVNLSWSDLIGADLSGANLSQAYLKGADLSRADLNMTNLTGANLSNANLSYANLTGANLKGANLRAAFLYRANLNGAILKGANLRQAYLSDANLSKANLTGAELRGARLQWVNFSKADLSGANLTDADLDSCIGNMKEIKTAQFDEWSIVWTKTPGGEDVLQIGCQRHSLDKWKNAQPRWISLMDKNALKWWEKYGQLVISLVEASPAIPWGK